MVVLRSSRRRIVHSNGSFKYATARYAPGKEFSVHGITSQTRNFEMKHPTLFLPCHHKQQQQQQKQQRSCKSVTHVIIVTLVMGFVLYYFAVVAQFWNRVKISGSNDLESKTSMRYTSSHVFEIKGEEVFPKPECSARRTPPFVPFGREICSYVRCSLRRTSKSLSGHIKLWHHTRLDRQSYNGEHMIEYEPMCILPPSPEAHIKVDMSIPGVGRDQSSPTKDSQPVVSIPTSPKWTCLDHANNFSIPHKKCVRFVAKADHGEFSLRDMSLTKLAPRNARWLGSPVYLFWLHARDSNVCHALMRFLFFWNHLRDREGYTPIYGANQDVGSPSIVIVANSTALFRLYSPLLLSFSNDSFVQKRLPFHAGLLYYMFQRCGINVIVVPSVSDLLKHGDKNGLCFRHAILMGSHSNRFAFPDVEVPPQTRKRRMPLLSYPLSTNALAISDFVFGHQPPASRRQSFMKAFRLVYVAREVGKRRSFEEFSENLLRSMLHDVCEQHFCTVDIFEASFSTPFYRQALTFRKADIVVGAHGAGLSLAVFSPVHCAIVEIAMANYWVPLFETLISGGRTYRLVRLQENSHINGTNLNVVSETDLVKIRRAVEDSIKNIYETVRRNN